MAGVVMRAMSQEETRQAVRSAVMRVFEENRRLLSDETWALLGCGLGDLGLLKGVDKDAGGYVYVIHLNRPFRHAKHYIGYTTDIVRRMTHHSLGHRDSSHFMKAVCRAGIRWSVTMVQSFEDAKEAVCFEKKLKRDKRSSLHCPLCKTAELERGRRAARDRMRRLRAG
ncbi:MAG: hypothetical protein GF414_00605 [Candidatus Altiarchaeales archaeon]|nr:hypothetical protein [Candidatus Altiarchaeales archaeon]